MNRWIKTWDAVCKRTTRTSRIEVCILLHTTEGSEGWEAHQQEGEVAAGEEVVDSEGEGEEPNPHADVLRVRVEGSRQHSGGGEVQEVISIEQTREMVDRWEQTLTFWSLQD
jgi:hypothetical protein